MQSRFISYSPHASLQPPLATLSSVSNKTSTVFVLLNITIPQSSSEKPVIPCKYGAILIMDSDKIIYSFTE